MIELKKFRCAMAVNATAVYHVANGVITGTDVLGFTPVKLQVPADVVTQKEDLAEGLAVLSHRMHHVSRSAPIFNPATAAGQR